MQKKPSLPVAIVIPWFGRDLTGGAELQAWQIAERLGRRGHSVDVLTTACRSALDHYGSNHHKPGRYAEEHFTIYRFKVNRRREKALGRAMAAIHGIPSTELFCGCSPLSTTITKTFAEELIHSPSLLRYLEDNSTKYRAFIFIPYLYSPILIGLPLVADRAYLQPCLHDEHYAYFSEVTAIFRQAKGLLFNSEGEYELARKLYGSVIDDKSFLIGEGVEFDAEKEKHFSKAHPKIGSEPFILYLGRKCKEKNVDLLVKAYEAFKDKNPETRLKLVLAGAGDDYSLLLDDSSLMDFGKISEEEKWQLMGQCRMLVQPSVNESFSRVIFEAWHAGRPVAVHGKCLATEKAVERSGGGWVASTVPQWVELFERLNDADDEQLSIMGAKGKAYAQNIANWDAVMNRYEEVLFEEKDIHSNSIQIIENYPRTSIHQLSAGFAEGDAISNITIKFRDYLRREGFYSRIYAEHTSESDRRRERVDCLSRFEKHKASLVLYHHSIGSHAARCALDFAGPKAFIYHNITPPELVRAFNVDLAKQLENGIADLSEMRDSFDIYAADSGYNARELKNHGVRESLVLPCFIDCEGLGVTGDIRVMRLRSLHSTNILFVGRICQHKQQHVLIDAFARYLNYNESAHLYIVGGGDPADAYYKFLVHRIRALKLENFVTLTGKVSNAELVSYFRIADLYWSFSAHEGFGIPLIEAMAFDVPVLAYGVTAIPEIMGEGGLIFNSLEDIDKVAALASILVKDRVLRSQVIYSQRENVKRFTWEKSRQVFAEMINNLLEKKFARSSIELNC
jgi:glycosyltransferase involved in cell wall biosynthesis